MSRLLLGGSCQVDKPQLILCVGACAYYVSISSSLSVVFYGLCFLSSISEEIQKLNTFRYVKRTTHAEVVQMLSMIGILFHTSPSLCYRRRNGSTIILWFTFRLNHNFRIFFLLKSDCFTKKFQMNVTFLLHFFSHCK